MRCCGRASLLPPIVSWSSSAPNRGWVTQMSGLRNDSSAKNHVDAMALVSRQAWEQVGGYADMKAWADCDFWCRFVEQKLSAAFVPEILCRYRVHAASMQQVADARVFSE